MIEYDLKRAYASAALNYEATKEGHEHGLTAGYIIKGFQGNNCYGPVFATRGEANRWLHAEYEHSDRGTDGKHTHITFSYPEPLMIVRVDQ